LLVVGEAADGAEAVQKAQELQPDLIVLDIGLPKLNGIEAAPRMSELSPRSKILFLSQDNDADAIQAAFSAGAWGYVHKLSAGTELLRAVEAVLQGQRVFTGGISCKEPPRTNPITATARSDVDAVVPS
jgi:DNA-binding NarL/FixJ family response regulator